MLVRSGSTVPVPRPHAASLGHRRCSCAGCGESKREGMSGRREDGGAPATGLASHAVLVVEDSRSPFACCHHGLARHRPPQAILSPNCSYMGRLIQAPGEDTSHLPHCLPMARLMCLHGRRHHDQFADSSQGENIVLSLFLSCVRSNFVQNLCGA